MSFRKQEKSLTQKLVELFYEEAPSFVLESIKESQEFIDKDKLEKKTFYERLFDNQIDLLRMFLVDQDFEIDNIDSLITCIRRQKDHVVEKAVDMYIPKSHIPFLIVLDFSSKFPSEKVSLMLDKNVNLGLSLGDVSCVKGCKGFHIIYDIENGRETIGKSSCCVNEIFKSSERFALAFNESVMLCFWDETLLSHSVICAGSFYKKEGTILGVPKILKGNELPAKVCFTGFNDPDELSGIPSCRCRDLFC